MGLPMRALDLQAPGAVDAALRSPGQGIALLLGQLLAIALHEVMAEARKGFRFRFGKGFGGGFRVGDCEDAGQKDGEIDGGELHSRFRGVWRWVSSVSRQEGELLMMLKVV